MKSINIYVKVNASSIEGWPTAASILLGLREYFFVIGGQQRAKGDLLKSLFFTVAMLH